MGRGCGTQPRKLREALEGGPLHMIGQRDGQESSGVGVAGSEEMLGKQEDSKPGKG